MCALCEGKKREREERRKQRKKEGEGKRVREREGERICGREGMFERERVGREGEREKKRREGLVAWPFRPCPNDKEIWLLRPYGLNDHEFYKVNNSKSLSYVYTKSLSLVYMNSLNWFHHIPYT